MSSGKQNDSDKPAELSLADIIRKHRKTSGSKTPSSGEESPQQPPKSSALPSAGMLMLRIWPWILLAGFAFSFFWDFSGQQLNLFGYVVSLEGLLRIVSISGLIGFTTNWLAIQMLFYPQKRRPILGQGLIPAQKEKIADRLSAAVERELINPDIIKKEFIEKGILKRYTDAVITDFRQLTSDPGFKKDVNRLLGVYVRRILEDPAVNSQIISQTEKAILENVKDSPVERNALKLYLLMKGKTLNDMLHEAVAAFPEHLGQAQEPIDQFIASLPARLRKDRSYIETLFITLLNTILDQIQIRRIVQESISRYDEEKLERIIRDTTDDHLKYIQYLGAVIGTVGGLIIWNPASLLLLIFTASALFLTDLILQRK